MPHIPWPSLTLVLTAERPQDIYRRPSVIQLVPAVMEPTAPAHLMKTIDHRWEAIPTKFVRDYAQDEVFAYTQRNDSSTPTYVGQEVDDDDTQTVLEEQQPSGRRGFLIGRKLSSVSLRPSLPKSWNKASLARLLQKVSTFDIRSSRLRVN